LAPEEQPKPALPQTAYVTVTHEGLVQACRERRIALGMSELDLHARAGWADGYTSKIEMAANGSKASNARGLGRESMPLMLQALGLEMAIVPKGAVRPKSPISMAERGRRGARKRLETMSPGRRAEIATAAARARWERAR
jgi:hypothetical protein